MGVGRAYMGISAEMWARYLQVVVLGGAVGAGALCHAAGLAWAHGVTERVSVRTGGGQARGGSIFPAVSSNGRFVAFLSGAPNLIARDTNNTDDVFVRDRADRTTERISISTNGLQGNDTSFDVVAISATGRFVAFSSLASNLVQEDTNGTYDVFVRDRRNRTTSRMSVSTGGHQASGGSIGSVGAAISGNGRFVTFVSDASDLVPNDTNNQLDVFVHDRELGSTRRVSVGTDGTQANSFSNIAAISADGRFVAFVSEASNLVPGDTNGVRDAFVRDLKTRTTRRVHVGLGGAQANAGINGGVLISANGRFVAFSSNASNLVPGDTNGSTDVFVRDRRMGTTLRESLGPGGTELRGQSFVNSISGNGRFIAFEYFDGFATDDRKNDSEVLVRNRRIGDIRRITSGCLGATVMGCSANGALSSNGMLLAFQAYADYLVPNDTNGENDIFVREFRF